MADYERIMLAEFGLHHVRIPSDLLLPGQVQIRRGGAPLGRFSLEDVFDGVFSNVATFPPARMADLERTSSDTYSLEASGKLSGPLWWLTRARASIAATGAKRAQLSALTGELTEIDQGALQRSLLRATARDDGPLVGNDIAVVIVAVASAKSFSIRFNDESGGRVSMDAAIAEGIAGELGVAARATSSSGLTISLDSPIPFAARVWRVKRNLLGFGRSLSVGTIKGPVELLGDAIDDSSFGIDIGLSDGALDLATD